MTPRNPAVVVHLKHYMLLLRPLSYCRAWTSTLPGWPKCEPQGLHVWLLTPIILFILW